MAENIIRSAKRSVQEKCFDFEVVLNAENIISFQHCVTNSQYLADQKKIDFKYKKYSAKHIEHKILTKFYKNSQMINYFSFRVFKIFLVHIFYSFSFEFIYSLLQFCNWYARSFDASQL